MVLEAADKSRNTSPTVVSFSIEVAMPLSIFSDVGSVKCKALYAD